ncbi:hypothetical protein GA0115252_163611, partial [Streptomyces sp. DfronAA-171]
MRGRATWAKSRPSVRARPGVAASRVAESLRSTVDVPRVVEVELDAGTEERLGGDADVVPAQHPGDDVHAVGAAPLEQVGDVLVERGELLAQGAVPVDEQHHVGGAEFVRPALGTQVAQLVERVDAVAAEDLLARGERGAHLGDGTGRALVVGAARDAADVRQAGERGEAAPCEVEAVERDVVRGVDEGEGEGEGAQQGRLAGLRAADDREVAARAGQVHVPGLLPLSRGVVEDADGHPQRAFGARQAEPFGRGLQGAGRLVERDRVRQGRQPDAADGRCGGELVDHDAEQPGPGRGRRGGGPGLGGRLRARERARPVRQYARSRVLLALAHRALVTPRHIRGFEAFVRGRVDLQVAEARERREVEGVGGVEDGAGLLGGEGAQAEAVGEVGVESLQAPALDALAGEEQVHADGAADAPDGEEQVDEVGLGGEEFPELVDDDEEMRERFEVRAARGALVGVRADVGEVPGVLEHLLSALDLARERGVHAFHEPRLILQVGDHPRDVREAREGREGGAALVVDEDEGELLRGVGRREGEDEGAQEFALAGAGGTDAQPVRSHAELRGLLEVEEHGLVPVGEADRHPQQLARGARAPQSGEVEAGRVLDAEERGEVDGPGDGRPLGGRLGGEPQRGEGAGEALGGGRAHLVGESRHGSGGRGARLGRPQVLHEQPLPVDRDAYRHVVRFVHPLAEQVQHRDPHVGEADRLVGAPQFRRDVTVRVADDEQPAAEPQRLPG